MTTGAFVVAAGCGTQVRSADPFASGSGASADGTESATGPSDDDDGSGVATSGADGSTSSDPGSGVKLDVGSPGSADDSAGGQMGCQKADFLFIIDNSGSMQDEQEQLVDSFPGFIGTIQQELMAQDYHIMVVDTDESPGFGSSLTCINGECSCDPQPQCCFGMCTDGAFGMDPPAECAGQPCEDFVLPDGCAVELGAGKAEDLLFEDCGFVSGKRYLTDQEPDLSAAFACAALVGAGGDGNERPMEAMERALGPLDQPGACNEGFLRDDAILVVTFITDEEEEGSPGDPGTWKQALIDAKNGNEEAIVMLGILGDSGIPGGVCTDGEAEDAPRLRQFTEGFVQGQWESVCADNYSPFFQEAVSVIDLACDNFVPEG